MTNINIEKYSAELKNKALLLCYSIFILVALMLGAQELISSSNSDLDSLINISGRQRMLSQKLAFQKSNLGTIQKETLNLFISSQDLLERKSQSNVHKYYKNELRTPFNNYVSLVSSKDIDKMLLVEKAESILIKLDKAVKLFEIQSNESQKLTTTSNILFVLLIMLVLLFMYFKLLKKQRIDIIATLKNYSVEKRKALEASKAKSQFLANMSHELRTPLNGIIGIGSSLKESSLDSTQQDDVETILNAGTFLSELINEVLDFSKFQSTEISINNKNFDLIELVNEINLLIEPLAHKKKIDFKVLLNKDVPQFFVSDAMRIKQLLFNLSNNAIKFTSEGWVSLRVHMLDDKLCFEVEDTGVGIKKESIETIFNEFSQVEDTYNKTQEGTGLGLSITKKIVDALGGTVEVKSVYGSGSKFTVVLNLKKGSKLITKPAQVTAEFGDKVKRALIVEDNTLNQVVLMKIFEKLGISNDIANNGAQAVELARSHNYSVIIMDISMPVMNGFEATKEIRKFNLDVPIFCLSANTFEEDKDIARKSGMNEFLEKPLKKDLLIGLLNKYFN